MTDNRSPDGGDWGEADLDPHERADADLNLDDPSAGDDEPWSPPDRQPRGAELLGVETDGGETLDQRHDAGGARAGHRRTVHLPQRQARGQRMVGGDDPDAIPAEEDVLGGPAGDDVGLTGEGPESSAMRLVEEDVEPE